MLDKLGITATSLCAIHCILLPLLLPILPLLGLSFLSDHHWEHVFLIGTAILGTVALTSGYSRYHRRLYPFCFLFTGLSLYWVKYDFSVAAEPFFIASGTSFIVLAHWLNIKLSNHSKTCPDHSAETDSQLS